MQRNIFLFIAVLLAACAGPISTAQPAAPSPMPTVAPMPDTSQYVPSIEVTIDLGLLNINRYSDSHPLALDAKAGLIYVGVSPSSTVVLNAATLKKVDSLPAGGNLSLDAEDKQTYIDVGGTYSADGHVTSGEIKLFTAPALPGAPASPGGSVILSDTSIVPPHVLADSTDGRAYIVRSGIFIAKDQSLEVTGSISGTAADPNGLVPKKSVKDAAPVPKKSVKDAAIDPARQRLYVSLNNGFSGSNNSNGLVIYDLTSGQAIAEDDERSVNSLAVDAVDGTACVSRIYMDTRSIVKVDGQGRQLRRLDGLSGEVQIDHGRNRVYVYDPWSRTPRIVVLDLDLNYLGETRLAGVDGLAFAFDAQQDRLLVLASDGRLIALRGHGQPPGALPLTSPATRGAVQWIAPSPNDVRDHLLYAAFAIGDERLVGMLFQSRDEGASWKFVAGLPVADSVTSLAFSPDYAADRTLFVSSGSPFISAPSSGVYRSLDGGLTWQPASRGLTELSIKRVVVSPDFAADHTLFANGVNRGLFRSEDGGATWTPLADRYFSMANDYDRSMLYTLGVSPQFAQDHSLLIGLNGVLLLSRDRGEAWTRVSTASVSSLAYASGSTIFAVTLDGLLRSDDGGESWASAGSGIDLSPGYDITVVASSDYVTNHTVFVLATYYGQPARLYHTQDGGQSWRQVDFDESAGAIALAPDGALFIGLRDGRVVKYRPTEP